MSLNVFIMMVNVVRSDLGAIVEGQRDSYHQWVLLYPRQVPWRQDGLDLQSSQRLQS